MEQTEAKNVGSLLSRAKPKEADIESVEDDFSKVAEQPVKTISEATAFLEKLQQFFPICMSVPDAVFAQLNGPEEFLISATPSCTMQNYRLCPKYKASAYVVQRPILF